MGRADGVCARKRSVKHAHPPPLALHPNLVIVVQHAISYTHTSPPHTPLVPGCATVVFGKWRVAICWARNARPVIALWRPGNAQGGPQLCEAPPATPRARTRCAPAARAPTCGAQRTPGDAERRQAAPRGGVQAPRDATKEQERQRGRRGAPEGARRRHGAARRRQARPGDSISNRHETPEKARKRNESWPTCAKPLIYNGPCGLAFPNLAFYSNVCAMCTQQPRILQHSGRGPTPFSRNPTFYLQKLKFSL